MFQLYSVFCIDHISLLTSQTVSVLFRVFRDLITLSVLGLREKGELQKLEKKWWYEKGQCGNTDGTAKVI